MYETTKPTGSKEYADESWGLDDHQCAELRPWRVARKDLHERNVRWHRLVLD